MNLMAATVLYPATPARQALAMRFGISYKDAMRDREWEVARADDFDPYPPVVEILVMLNAGAA